MSGEFGGTTLTEMRHSWKLRDLLDARDLLAYKRAIEHASIQEQKAKAKQK